MKLELGTLDTFGRMLCPCGLKTPAMWVTCDRSGEAKATGMLLRCFECGRILTHDGAVIGRLVTA